MQKKAKDAIQWTWQNKGTLIYGFVEGYTAKSNVLGFDMDDTLIKVKSGAKFAKNATDWLFWNDKVAPTIQKYVNDGYSIVIFTNQNGITTGKTSANDIKTKIQDLQTQLNVPLAAFIASDDDGYRKPTLGMWEEYQNLFHKDIQVDIPKSIYCGDAAGRVNGKHKDFSDSDLKFAINIGLIFRTPEQLFLLQDLDKDYAENIGFNPKQIKKDGPLFKNHPEKQFVKPDKPEMIICIGSVGSGKSTFTVNHLKDYVRVNRDTLKTKEKCLKVAEDAMKQMKYLAIDNTNPTAADRADFIKLAKAHKYPIRAFFFEITKEHAMHNDIQRSINTHRQHLSKKVGKIPIHSFFKNHQHPTTDEGFDEVRIVNFVPGPFISKDDEEAYFSFVKGK